MYYDLKLYYIVVFYQNGHTSAYRGMKRSIYKRKTSIILLFLFSYTNRVRERINLTPYTNVDESNGSLYLYRITYICRVGIRAYTYSTI